jgi:hypothetical protein
VFDGEYVNVISYQLEFNLKAPKISLPYGVSKKMISDHEVLACQIYARTARQVKSTLTDPDHFWTDAYRAHGLFEPSAEYVDPTKNKPRSSNSKSEKPKTTKPSGRSAAPTNSVTSTARKTASTDSRKPAEEEITSGLLYTLFHKVW